MLGISDKGECQVTICWDGCPLTYRQGRKTSLSLPRVDLISQCAPQQGGHLPSLLDTRLPAPDASGPATLGRYG